MPTTDDDIEEIEDNDDDEDLEDVDDDDVEGALSTVGEEEDAVEESLEALRDRRPAAARRASEEGDTDDIMSLTSERLDPSKIPLPERVDPLKDRQEFVCSRCHLVKSRSQLADKDRMLCRDCV